MFSTFGCVLLTCLCGLQAFQETIEIFHQKNETFKSASKDVEEVSVSATTMNMTSDLLLLYH